MQTKHRPILLLFALLLEVVITTQVISATRVKTSAQFVGSLDIGPGTVPKIKTVNPKLTTLRLVSKKVKFLKDLGTGNINLLFLVVLQLFDIKGQTSSGAQNVVVGRVLTTLKRMVNLLREQQYQRRIPLFEPQ